MVEWVKLATGKDEDDGHYDDNFRDGYHDDACWYWIVMALVVASNKMLQLSDAYFRCCVVRMLLLVIFRAQVYYDFSK